MLAGEGDFTCCARNHDFGAGPVPCDKIKVRAVLEQMLDTKAAVLFDAGKHFEARPVPIPCRCTRSQKR